MRKDRNKGAVTRGGHMREEVREKGDKQNINMMALRARTPHRGGLT